MAYIGQKPVVGNFRKCDALTASATATYNLTVGSVAVVPGSVNQMVVSLNGVIQSPTSAYTISGSQIIFDSALTSSDVIDFILIYGDILDVGTVTDSAITTAKIADNNVTTAKLAATSVTAAKLNNDIISGSTELASAPADTDEFLVSDAGTLKRVDYSLIKGGGSYEFVSRTAVGGSDVASIAFTNLSTSGENYLFQWNGIDSTANSSEDFYFQVSTDNGSNYRTSDYKSATFQFYSDGGEDSYSASAAFSLSENQVGSEVNSGNCGFLYLMNMASSQKTAVVGENVTVGDSSNRVRANVFGGFYNAAEDTDAVRFIFQSGNISASTVGFITMYKQVIA